MTRSIRKRLQFGIAAQAMPLVLCVIAIFLYLPSLTSDFVYDDHFQIVHNPQIQSWDYVQKLLFTDVWSQKGPEHVGHYYRPVFSVWMLLLFTIAGPHPWLWHFSNALLHASTTYLVYRLCDSLFKSIAAASFGSLLYAVHPIHVDAVSWISASNELLLAIFVLGALLTLAQATTENKQSWLALSAGLYGLALLSKETAIAILPVFPVVCWFTSAEEGEGRVRKRKWSTLHIIVLYLIPAMLYLAVRWFILDGAGLDEGKHAYAEVVLNSPKILVFYLQKLFWPVGLAGFYVNPLVPSPTNGTWLTGAALLIGIGLVVWFSLSFLPCCPYRKLDPGKKGEAK